MVAKGGNQSLLRELEPLEREMCKKSRQKLFGSLSVTLVFICFFFSTPLQLPEIPTASLYSSPPPVLSISFPQNQKFEVFLSQRYFTAVIQTLMQLTLFFFLSLSLPFPLTPPLPWSDLRHSESRFPTEYQRSLQYPPCKSVRFQIESKSFSDTRGNSSFMELSFFHTLHNCFIKDLQECVGACRPFWRRSGGIDCFS